jgi:chromatin segregation and condensation protein Rec8/ScpA/Scc1 (kleisin family)
MKIDIGIYYGPIDLLVYLVRKKEVDIFDIPIAQIAEEYLDYIRKIEREDLEDAADFLLMAAILIRLKKIKGAFTTASYTSRRRRGKAHYLDADCRRV